VFTVRECTFLGTGAQLDNLAKAVGAADDRGTDVQQPARQPA
jgi:hypothetical protein